MKKILNWTVGSFFRTIGRTIAFLVMGCLIYYILSYNGFGLDDLFFQKVNAATLTTEVEDFSHPYITLSNENEMQTINWDRYSRTIYSTTSYSIQNYEFVFNNISSDVTQADYIEIPFSITQPYTVESTNTNYEVYCHEWTCTSIDDSDGLDTCVEWSCTDTRRSGFTNYEQYDSEIKNMNFTISMEFTNNTFSYCEINNNMIICPNNKRTPTKFILQSNFRTTKSTSVNFVMNRAFNLYRKLNIQDAINNNTQAITNQTQQDQQQHQEMMDSNTTEAEDEATSFFEDFDAPDIGGLSGVITAPLSTIQSLLNSTCTNLTLPLPFVNENITLPCMSTIYSEHFGAFFTIYQTIILAIICYRCIRSIFFDIQGFTDPNDDRIEVMDL